MTLKKKRIILCVASWILRVLPLIILFAIKWDNWVETSAESQSVANFKLATGGILVMAFIGLAVVDKLPKPNGLIFPTMLFLISYALTPILHDLTLILGMYVLGGVLSLLIDTYNKEVKRKINIEEGAQANGNEMRTILAEFLGENKTNE